MKPWLVVARTDLDFLPSEFDTKEEAIAERIELEKMFGEDFYVAEVIDRKAE